MSPRPNSRCEIAPVTVELAPNRIISTIGYNGTSPGPLLRMKEGVPVTVNVVNKTDVPEYVHFHGLLIPADVDGWKRKARRPCRRMAAAATSSRPRPRARAGITRTPCRWTICIAAVIPACSGFWSSRAPSNPGNFDQEHYLALRDWEPYFTSQADGHRRSRPSGAQPEKPAVLDTRQPGHGSGGRYVFDQRQGAGRGRTDPREAGERVLFHFLNASAIENRHLALPGHKFNVIALDGNPVPTPAAVDVLMLGPGERIDAGRGDESAGRVDHGRARGSGARRRAGRRDRIRQPAPHARNGWRRRNRAGITRSSASRHRGPAPTERLEMMFRKIPRGAGKFNSSR